MLQQIKSSGTAIGICMPQTADDELIWRLMELLQEQEQSSTVLLVLEKLRLLYGPVGKREKPPAKRSSDLENSAS